GGAMRRGAMIVTGAFAALGLGAAAGEVKYGSELRLELARDTVPGFPEKSSGILLRLMNQCAPTYDLKKTQAGEVSLEFVLRIGYGAETELNAKEAEEFAKMLDVALFKGRAVARLDGKECMAEVPGDGGLVNLTVGSWRGLLSKAECVWFVAYLRASLGGYEAFSASWNAHQHGEKDVDFADSKIGGWRLIYSLGAVELKEFGNFWVFLNLGWSSAGGNWEETDVVATGQSMLGRTPSELLEALAQIPPLFEKGEVYRWKTAEMMLRAFPENKSIYFRQDRRTEEDVRIHVTAALEARRVIKERDRLMVWCEETAQPALEALVKTGDAGFFGVWR
ncbi:MAG: hypothetical protein O3A92_16085, partial [Verrucomicrobia bacterium]|nr:hypothetical protein [Verrucomicrobiota bacterium]